jgi:small subunit ribosomal protein S6
MALYEHTFLARQDISAQQVDSLVEKFKGVLVENGGSVGKVENWGLRTATYRIKKNRKAHYILMNVDAPSAAVAEMERQMRINDDILRYLTIRVENHDDEPSAMMKKNDRDDRPRRDGPRDGGRDGGRDTRPARAPRSADASEKGE